MKYHVEEIKSNTMSSKKANGIRKDPLKTPKVWERARREKMKIYFNELEEVLPFYDPSAPMSRFEILQRSKTYIKDLQDQNQDLLNGGFDEVYKIKMTKLRQRVKELLKRVDQLTDLLRTANIMIPPIEAFSDNIKTPDTLKWMNQRPKKWTEKINLVVPDDKIKSVLSLIKDYKKNSGKSSLKRKQVVKTSEKGENFVIKDSCIQKTVIRKKKVLKRKSKVINLKASKADDNYEKSDSFNSSQSPSQFKENQPVDFNLLSNNEMVVNKSVSSDQSNSTLVETSRNAGISTTHVSPSVAPVGKVTISQKLIDTQTNVIVPPTANVLPSNTFILTNDGSLVQLPILNSTGTVFSTNSNLLAPATIVKPNTGLLTPLVINKPSPVIVLQKPQIIQTAQIINPTPQVISVSKPNIHILGGSVLYTSSTSVANPKTLPHIMSKAPANKKKIARDSTVTTYVNKIPIPALSKQSYAKKSSAVNTISSKDKSTNVKEKDVIEKSVETSNENLSHNEKQNSGENVQNKETNSNMSEKDKIIPQNNTENHQKRYLTEEKTDDHKKQKLDEGALTSTEENVFKPIEHEPDGMFCNLALPNSMNPSLSVSPTAAFLSSFPIVAPIRSEADDDLSERKIDEDKNSKEAHEAQPSNLEKSNDSNKQNSSVDISKGCLTESSSETNLQTQVAKEKPTETPKEQMKIPASLVTNANKNNASQQLDNCKPWDHFHHENCEIRSEAFYLPTDGNIQINNSTASMDTANAPAISFSALANEINNTSYNAYPQNPISKGNIMNMHSTINDHATLKNPEFEYQQNLKIPSYGNERSALKKQCSNTVNESYSVPKSQGASYQLDSGPSYQLIPAKEVPNQRNARTVNWMTEPDVRNRGMIYSTPSDKMNVAKTSGYAQPDNFYINNQKISSDCSGHFVANDQNKINYHKNDFYVKEQRCKTIDKRADPKTYKHSQNSYNIFDYNYSNCYTEDDSNKYCQVQSYSAKAKKNITQTKKKSEEVHHVSNEAETNDPTKRLQDQIITNIDFNPVTNQECFTWMPGKNVDWLPSKSFGLDTNLVVPSTLPTLVGDLALGTTSTNDINQNKNVNSKTCQAKSNITDITKDYTDLGMGNPTLPKPMDAVDANKQYLEPFTNLSKNIFDVTPSNVHSAPIPKNDFEKINFSSNDNNNTNSNNNETIVLKNIFELPVSKSSGNEFSRSKQRNINSSQNTFLSVSQLVDPPTFEGNSMKNDNQMDSSKDPFSQNYANYNHQKTYKNKSRSSHCKYNDRKYHGYKNGSSSYTAEALIRSNNNINYQPNDFLPVDVNTNFFNGKSNQKPEQFSTNNKIDFEVNMKTDFGTGPTQNIYSDFNFSSPVPNFTIGPTVGTDFGNHDSGGNFSAQNNAFFSDFIAPEYPLPENVPNSLLLPPCSIALQNPFAIEKRNNPTEKNKNNKQYSASRNRKHFECPKSTFNQFPISSTTTILTTSSLSCHTIFTTSACQNLLPVPTQSIPISFSSPSFSTSNISFPPLTSNTNTNYHRLPNPTQNSTSSTFLPSNSMFTTCTSKTLPSSHNGYSNPLTTVTNSVISSPFPMGNVPFSSSSQSSIPFFSLSNPIIPSSAPTSSSNSLANFNLSTIFPEINQKGNYHYS